MAIMHVADEQGVLFITLNHRNGPAVVNLYFSGSAAGSLGAHTYAFTHTQHSPPSLNPILTVPQFSASLAGRPAF